MIALDEWTDRSFYYQLNLPQAAAASNLSRNGFSWNKNPKLAATLIGIVSVAEIRAAVGKRVE